MGRDSPILLRLVMPLFHSLPHPALLFALSLLLFLPIPPARGQLVFPQDHSPQAIARMKANVAYLVEMSEEELRARIPVESGGIWFTDCPNCEFGSQDRGRFDWSPEKPHQIQCQGCREVYPNNPTYPDDKYIPVDAPNGTHHFSYWENEDGYRIFFRAHADYLHREELERSARLLGRIYAATGEDRYARTAAIILHRFAEVVPGYAYIFDFPYRQKLFSPYSQNRLPVPAYRTSLWTRWAYNDIPQSLLEAYDCLHGWTGWADIGPHARETIERDLFTHIVEFVLGFEDPLTNMSPRIWQDAIYAGRILGRPEWVHESLQRFRRMLNEQFLHDGHWYETSPSYHAMTIAGMRRVMDAADGHSDPPGYRHPETGRRYDDLDLRREVPQYGLAIRALIETRLPSGRLLPVNDTWAVHGRSDRERQTPRDYSESLLMPGLGIAILAHGRGDDQFFSWLNFTSGTAHKQRDTLSLGLFAGQEELLPDIGYTHTRYRRSWASSMMSHNTIVVDGVESKFDDDHTGNRLVAFTSAEGFHLAAAESLAAYPETSRYRRTLMVLGEDAQDSYLLDVFEVRGGTQHDYILHGSADRDSSARIAGVDLRPYSGTLVNPGAEFSEPRGEHDEMGDSGSFSFVRNLRRGDPEGPIELIFALDDREAGSRSLILPPTASQAYLGQSPSLRRAAESDARIDDHHRPSFVLRRKGDDLNTVFIAIHQPLGSRAPVTGLSASRANGRIWIQVSHPHGRDHISIAEESDRIDEFDTPDGLFVTDAAYAAVRVRDGGGAEMHLVNGASLRLGDLYLEGPGSIEGEVLEVAGEEAGGVSFVVAEPVQGRPHALIIQFPDQTERSFTITGVKSTEGRSEMHVREAAGFTRNDGQIRITSYPAREIEGELLRYRLLVSAHRVD